MSDSPLRILPLIVAGAILGLGSGCPSAVVAGSARTLDRGKLEVYAANGLLAPPVAPRAEVGARYGLSDQLELGGRLYTNGVQLETKYALLRPESGQGLHLSVSPAVAYDSVLDADPPALVTQLPVLVSYRWSRLELVASPRLQAVTLLNDGGTQLRGGGSIGALVRVSDHFALMPELSAVLPFWGGTPGYGTAQLAVLVGF